MLTRQTLAVYSLLDVGRGRPPTFRQRPRAMCTAPRSCYTFRSVDDEKVHADEKHVDFVLFLMGRTRPPAYAPPQTAALDVHRVLFLLHYSQHRRR